MASSVSDSNMFSRHVPVTKRSTHTAHPVIDALCAFAKGNLHDFDAILKEYGSSDTFKAEVVGKLKADSNSVSQKSTLTALKLFLDYIDPGRNAWLADVYSDETGEDAVLIAARFADPATMQCILKVKTMKIDTVSRYELRGVLWTAVHHNKDLSTIRYLIGVLYASRPDDIPLNMYNALAGPPLVGGETLEKFLYLLDPTTQARQTVDMLFHLSVAFGQHTILQHLFKCRLPTDMSALISRVCNLDDMETTKVMLGELDDCHSARLLKNALEAGSIKTLPAVIRSHYSRKMQLTFGVGMQMSGFLELAARHDNIIAWRLLLVKWPKVWGTPRGVVYYALKAPSVQYIDFLHERGHTCPPSPPSSAGSKSAYTQYLEYAVKHGCYKTIQWVIENLNPVIVPRDLIKRASLKNRDYLMRMIVFCIDSWDRVVDVDPDQDMLEDRINEKRLNDIQVRYLNKQVSSDEYKHKYTHTQAQRAPQCLGATRDEMRMGVFMSVLVHCRKYKRSCSLPPASGIAHNQHMQEAVINMINFDTETRDGLQQALLPAELVGIILEYGWSIHDAVKCAFS
jgi:hypothetical protein